jgi:hypothetical protein
MSVEASTPICEICGGKGHAQIVLQAGPNPQVSRPLDCPKCNDGDWEVWECLMPRGWNRGKWNGS